MSPVYIYIYTKRNVIQKIFFNTNCNCSCIRAAVNMLKKILYSQNGGSYKHNVRQNSIVSHIMHIDSYGKLLYVKE